MIVVLFLLKITLFVQTECAKILGVIPVASYSHQVPFHPFWRELSLRGHQVTVMTTNPLKDPSLTNLTEIDLSYSYEIYSKHGFSDFASNDSKSFTEIARLMKNMLDEVGDYQFKHPQVQELIHNKEIKFDVVMVEAQLPAMMAFSWRFNCPMIGITSLDSGMQYHLAMGNPVHPMINPDPNLPIEETENMTFRERISSFIYYISYSYFFYHKVYPEVHEKLKKIFDEDVPNVEALHDNMVMLFINTHPIFQGIRLLNPNTVTIGGGIHLQKPKPLPKHLQNYLDKAEIGAIYFSLGTNVNTKMVRETMPQIMEALGELPYKVLLKTDTKLEEIPGNVAVYDWLPQQDILRHPNVKLFITQGGLQSLQEAVYNGVPVIGVPFLGDQITNVNRMVVKGYGLKINKNNVTRESLMESVLEVMNNSKYRDTVKELSAIYQDQEAPSLQRAVWWTEYVIRHKGARHLRNPVVDMPFWKYYMLDVIGFLISVIFLFIIMCYRMIKCVMRLISRWNSSKIKVQ